MDKIFYEKEIKKFINSSKLYSFQENDIENWEEPVKLISQKLESELKNDNKQIAFLPLFKTEDQLLETLIDKLKDAMTGREIYLATDLIDASNYVDIILIIKLGTTTKNELSLTQERLSIQNKFVKGWIALNPIEFNYN
jgi:hypothetical protein